MREIALIQKEDKTRFIDKFAKMGRRQPVWLLLVILLIIFSFQNSSFLSVANLSNILLQGSYVGFLALGITLVMLNGNIDLTVGSMVSLTACLAIGLQEYGVIQGALIALVVGTSLGFLNGIIVEKTGVDSFIVTLGGLIGIKGLVFLYTNRRLRIF